jgi:hypothetical protein
MRCHLPMKHPRFIGYVLYARGIITTFVFLRNFLSSAMFAASILQKMPCLGAARKEGGTKYASGVLFMFFFLFFFDHGQCCLVHNFSLRINIEIWSGESWTFAGRSGKWAAQKIKLSKTIGLFSDRTVGP